MCSVVRPGGGRAMCIIRNTINVLIKLHVWCFACILILILPVSLLYFPCLLFRLFRCCAWKQWTGVFGIWYGVAYGLLLLGHAEQ